MRLIDAVEEIRQQIETLNEIKEKYIKSIRQLEFERQILESGLREIERKIERKQNDIKDLYKRQLIPLNMDGGKENGDS